MNRMTLGLAGLMLIFLTGASLIAEPGVDVAGFVNQADGIDAGMALVINDNDGKLTAGLAKDNRLTVQGCTWDAKAVQPSRAVVLAAGVMDRASIVLVEADGLPYVDSLVNVMVCATWGGRLLDVAELLRVLAPDGVALIGNDANPAAIAGLDAKLKQAGAKDIKVLSRKGWIQFSKTVDPRFDVWTHNLGGADLSSVNGDQVAGPWSEVRWIGEPRWGSLYMTYSGRATGGGRIYYKENRAAKWGGETWLVARDAWNGFELWRLSVGPAKRSGGIDNTLSCDEKQVYSLEEGKTLIARDGRTGRKVRDYDPGFLPSMATSEGAVLLVCNLRVSPPVSTQVAALDKASGKVLWTRPGIVHPAAEKGVAFVLTAQELEAVELATGKSLWKTAVTKGVGNPWVFCKAGFVYVQRKGTDLAAYDAKKGTLLWKREKPPCHYGAFPYPDGLWLVDLVKKGTNNVVVLDSKTGSKKRELKASLGACFPLTGSANYLLYLHSYYLDLKTGEESKKSTVRSPCMLGHVPANGLTYYLPHHCDCGISLRGFLAMAPEGMRKWKSEEGVKKNPSVVTVGVAPSAPPVEKPDDWPMYRKDTVRSNFMPGKLPAPLQLLWSLPLGNSRLSQAVSAYGIVFTTEPKSHRVFARDAATGKERWSFIADGRTDYPPALQKGLCFFSTSAGSVYALDAATGKEVWRMRAAPVEKYIAEEGQFVSAWPVIGGVMPMKGDLFFTCGRSVNVDGGIWMFAVEAATGKIRWRVKGGVSSGDFFLSDGKELVFNGNRYDVNTGKALGARANTAKGILKTNTYFTQVALADYMACVEPALAHQKHIELTDGNVHGENLAFSDKLGVAAWNYRTGFHVPTGMMKKEKAEQPFIYSASEGKNNWLMDESLPQQMMGVILVGETAYMAGVPTPASMDQKPELWVLGGADGKKLQVIPLESRPVYDGLSTAGGRLYLVTEDGRLICFGVK